MFRISLVFGLLFNITKTPQCGVHDLTEAKNKVEGGSFFNTNNQTSQVSADPDAQI